MIVIPMAGLSSRFTKAGYPVPKYMLPLQGRSVFAHTVRSFKSMFATTPFLFIARAVADTPAFIERECAELGIANIRIVILDRETEGQADTVALGLDQAQTPDATPITIFNIDTIRRDFRLPTAPWFETSDGYLEVFHGEGANWSYVGPAENTDEPLAARTTEKNPISNLCCDGLYHFARTADFRRALQAERAKPGLPELYVAPLYNHLIKAGLRIHYDLVPLDVITFCGIPTEYEAAKTANL